MIMSNPKALFLTPHNKKIIFILRLASGRRVGKIKMIIWHSMHPFSPVQKKQQFQKNSVILSKLYHFLMLYMGNPPPSTFSTVE